METMETSEHGRPVVWMSRWSWHRGKSSGMCLYATEQESVMDFIWNAIMFLSPERWQEFPNPARGAFPDHDERGGGAELTPRYRIEWDGGWSEVDRMEVGDRFVFGPQESVVNIYSEIERKRAEVKEERASCANAHGCG